MVAKLRRLIPILVVVGAGLAVFLITRYSANGPVDAAAQSAPAPGPEARQLILTLQAENAKPDFEGQINGFTFYDRAKVGLKTPAECNGLPNGGRDATADEIRTSPLYFAAGYLPAGAQERTSGGNNCRGTVVVVIRNFSLAGGAFVTVAHVKMPPELPKEFPTDRLEAATIGGRPALVVKPLHSRGQTVVYMRDDGTHWVVSGARLSRDEVVKIAESVK